MVWNDRPFQNFQLEILEWTVIPDHSKAEMAVRFSCDGALHDIFQKRCRRHMPLMVCSIASLFLVYIGRYVLTDSRHYSDFHIKLPVPVASSQTVPPEVPWVVQSPRGFQKALPPLVWQYGEESRPYFLSPVLQVPNDTSRRRTLFSLTDIVSLFKPDKTEKLVLLYDMPKWHKLKTRHKNSLKNCPVKTCRLSENKTLLPEADVVVFYVLSILDDKPPQKPTNQMWVFFAHEPQWNFPRWIDMFNWTMTFRLDSDIVCPYFVLLPKPKPDVRNFRSIAERKSGLVMWLVSNCKTRSKRENYVKELHNYIKIDIYGRCGIKKCNRFGNGSCDEMKDKYKFYLAFENSLCDDYITEKLFSCYALDIIPVVRGGARYDGLLPRGTYINTAHFSSPKHLADYLNYLDSNDTAYAEILRKKSQFTLTKSESTFESSLCDICIKLHNFDRFANTYYDINKWWYSNSCRQPVDL